MAGKPTSGRKNNQRMKAYLIYDYLMRETDENHVASGYDIVEYLKKCGIHAERRSVYKDIEEINKVILMTTRDNYGLPKAETFEIAEELLNDETQKTIVYDEHLKGFYMRKRHYKVNDIRILAECIYAAKFIDEKRAKRLVNVVCDLVSEHHAEDIKRDALLLDRVKTENVLIYEYVSKISAAMSRKRNKKPHTPEKIKFKYTTYTIQDGIKRTLRRNGNWYMVSPYKLIISDGYYYLLGYDDRMHKIVHFRVDRIEDLELTGDPRRGEKEFEKLNMEDYLKEHFGMFPGELKHIHIRASIGLLNTFIDRFGTNMTYLKDDGKHFIAIIHVAVSKQFYGWLCGFGDEVQILSPASTVEEFKQHLDKMRGLYER